MSHHSVVVVEDHNLRLGEACDEEVEQCVLDINMWFGRNGINVEGEASTKEDLQQLQKMLDCAIPKAFIIYLLGKRGQWWFMDKEAIDVQDIPDLAASAKLPSRYIPFAADVDRISLLVVEEETARVLEITADDDPEPEQQQDVVAKSFSSFLEAFRDKLLGGKVELLTDVGLIEKVRK